MNDINLKTCSCFCCSPYFLLFDNIVARSPYLKLVNKDNPHSFLERKKIKFSKYENKNIKYKTFYTSLIKSPSGSNYLKQSVKLPLVEGVKYRRSLTNMHRIIAEREESDIITSLEDLSKYKSFYITPIDSRYAYKTGQTHTIPISSIYFSFFDVDDIKKNVLYFNDKYKYKFRLRINVKYDKYYCGGSSILYFQDHGEHEWLG